MILGEPYEESDLINGFLAFTWCEYSRNWFYQGNIQVMICYFACLSQRNSVSFLSNLFFHIFGANRPLLADIIQAEDVKELCKLLVVVSGEAAKALAGN